MSREDYEIPELGSEEKKEDKIVEEAAENKFAVNIYEDKKDILTNRLSTLNQIATIVKGALIKDTDYGYIPGCGNKPSLLQPGANKICLLYGLVPKFSVPTIINNDVIISCEISNSKGVIIGQSNGSAHIDQPEEIKNGKVRDNGYYLNKAIKMAQKRAKVGAVLSFSNLTSVFTQDIEDDTTNKQIITYEDKQIVYDLVKQYTEKQGLDPKNRKENWIKFCSAIQELAISVIGEELPNAYYITKHQNLLTQFKQKYEIE